MTLGKGRQPDMYLLQSCVPVNLASDVYALYFYLKSVIPAGYESDAMAQ
jgi:hypothetical protein